MESFNAALFGYSRGQVDVRVNELKSELDKAMREIEGLRMENARLSAELASVHASANEMARQEAAVKEALVSAHRQSEEVLAEARRESETLLQVSREAGMRLQDDLKGRISDLNWQIERLSLQKQKFSSEFKAMLERQLQELSVPSEPQLFPQEEQPAPIVIEEIMVEPSAPSEKTS